MGSRRYVAFGTFLLYQNAHRIEDDHLVQLSEFYPSITKGSQTGFDVTDEGEATAAELSARYGRVIQLPEAALEVFRAQRAAFHRSAEAHANRIAEERRVDVVTDDPVLRIEVLDRFASATEMGEALDDGWVSARTLEVAERVAGLSEEEMANYENWRRQLTARPEPTAREWLAAARAALEFAHRQP